MIILSDFFFFRFNEMSDMHNENGVQSEGLQELLWGSSSSYIPQVKPEYKPKLDQEFALIDDVHEFYNQYAKEAGFSVRSNTTRKNKDTDEIVRKEYVCSKEGMSSKGVASENKRRRGITRENCNAKLAVVRTKIGTYKVSVFVEDHSHPLTSPRKVHLLRSHRNMSSSQKPLSQQLADVNIPTWQQVSFLELQAGGMKNMGCIERDFYNHQRNMRKELEGHDVDLLYEHFISKQEKNPAFYFAIKKCQEDRLTHCFWVDAKLRSAYKYFGDVVVFDSTYNTNRYGMIFAPFIGVNNHGQTIILACSLHSDETSDSFVWLLEQFKKNMPGGPPKMIITNQDPAMTKAISQALPDTFHRYCIWHILNKFSEKLDAVVYKYYYKYFQKCIWESCTKEEFDSTWMTIIGKSKLVDNGWLQSIYEIRSKWVPVYVNHVFSAGMSSSQRVESSHAFFKRFVSKRNSLVDFITRFNRAIARQRREELTADHVDVNEKPVLKMPNLIEKQMAETYTRKIFYTFQQELWNSFFYDIELVRENSDHFVYTVKRQDESSCRIREIVFKKELDFTSCSCKKFESEGIPCRHILAYLNHMQVRSLPNQYILKRWTQTAKCNKVIYEYGLEINDFSDKSFMLRRMRLFQLATCVIDKAACTEDASKILEDILNNAILDNKSTLGSGGSGGVFERNNVVQHVYNEPLAVRAKGCGKRLKGGKEKAKNKAKDSGRCCNGCGKVGQAHDKRNCPILNNRYECDTLNNSLYILICLNLAHIKLFFIRLLFYIL